MVSASFALRRTFRVARTLFLLFLWVEALPFAAASELPAITYDQSVLVNNKTYDQQHLQSGPVSWTYSSSPGTTPPNGLILGGTSDAGVITNGDTFTSAIANITAGSATPTSSIAPPLLLTSEMVYSLEVLGPAGGTVPLLITANGSAAITGNASSGGDAAAGAMFRFGSINPLNGLFSDIYSFSAYAGSYPPSFFGITNSPGSFSLNSSLLTVSTNTVYTIWLESQAGGAATLDGGTARVDAFIVVNPQVPNAGDYNLVFSPGIPGAVPEPSSAQLLCIGVALFVCFLGIARKRAS